MIADRSITQAVERLGAFLAVPRVVERAIFRPLVVVAVLMTCVGVSEKWSGTGFGQGTSFEVTRAVREVLLGTDPPVALTQRATTTLKEAREVFLERVHPGGTLIVRDESGQLHWWTWAGHRANATLAATLEGIAVPAQRINDHWIRLREDITPPVWKEVVSEAPHRLCLPPVDERAVRGLKFGDALPPRLAEATLSARLVDLYSATAVLGEPVRFVAVHT